MRIGVGTRVGPFWIGASERVGRSPAQRRAAKAARSAERARAWRTGGFTYRAGVIAFAVVGFTFLAGFAFPPLFAVCAVALVAGLVLAIVRGAREALAESHARRDAAVEAPTVVLPVARARHLH